MFCTHYGVNDNSDFELMFCEKFNAIARLYDHTVDAPPLNKECFYFFKKSHLLFFLKRNLI